MAEEPEHRMLFDLRGKRKRVIQVIYVLLAVIMALSLVVIGLPGGIGLGGGGSSGQNTDLAQTSIDRAETLEARIKAKPNNIHAREELIRARIAAGNNLIEIDEDTGARKVGADASTQYSLAAQAWEKYLKKTENQPDQGVAQIIANTLFTLSQGSTVAQFESNIADAARAQAFVADQAVAEWKKNGPSPAGPLTTLATYQYYAQDFAAADASRKQALASTPDKAEQKQIKTQLDSVKKDAKRIGKLLAQAKKQAKKDGGKSLQEPAGSLGSGGTLGTPTP